MLGGGGGGKQTKNVYSAKANHDKAFNLMYIYHIFTENVAYGKNATQSETYVFRGHSTSACAAVNGRTGSLYTVIGEKNCVHTADAPGGWWLVDLGRKYTITDVTIYNRAGNLLTNRQRKDERECVWGAGGGGGGRGGWKGGGGDGKGGGGGRSVYWLSQNTCNKKIDINDMVGKY